MYSDNRLLRVAVFLMALWILGIVGYMIIEGWNFFDSLYMTVISFTTVGYEEVHPLSQTGRAFTIVILMAGVGLFFYAFGILADAFVEGYLKGVLEKKKMEKAISKLSNHFIVCGYGRIGKTISRIISERNIPVVVIENDPEIIKEIEKQKHYFIEGDATQDEVLLRAGVERAKGVICVLQSDADNVYITLTARSLNPGLMIEARASDNKSEKKMIQAGADRVISPYEVGAWRMALAVLQPTVTEFLDLAVHSPDFDLRVEQLEILPGSRLDGVTLMQANIRKMTGATVLAVQQLADKMIFGPDPNYMLRGGDIMVALGREKEIASLKELASS